MTELSFWLKHVSHSKRTNSANNFGEIIEEEIEPKSAELPHDFKRVIKKKSSKFRPPQLPKPQKDDVLPQNVEETKSPTGKEVLVEKTNMDKDAILPKSNPIPRSENKDYR